MSIRNTVLKKGETSGSVTLPYSTTAHLRTKHSNNTSYPPPLEEAEQPRPIPSRPCWCPRPGIRLRSCFTTFSSRSWNVRIDVKHALIPIRRIRRRTRTKSDHTCWNHTWDLTRGRHAHGITPRRPWHNIALTTTSLSISPGGDGRCGKVVEKRSCWDVKLKLLFIAPIDWACGNAHYYQTLMRVSVEWWGCRCGFNDLANYSPLGEEGSCCSC